LSRPIRDNHHEQERADNRQQRKGHRKAI
jgi:hypothetical protein